ncbi:MAG: response regulator [Gammaproteobacteria bacterium]|nr:response regulator [Gammaproteobacteria bacterium]
MADDDEDMLSITKALLERDGYQVYCTTNGVDAIRLCGDFHPDALIIDAIMPIMDGFEAVAVIANKFREKKFPILMVTNLDDKQSIELAYKAGASDFIPKPVHWTVLLHRLRQLINTYQNERALDKERQNALENRIAHENQLMNAHKMEAIGRLAGGIAHDFNNILTAVIGYADLSIHSAKKHADNDLLRYLGEISIASERARRLIKKILTYSRNQQDDNPILVNPIQVAHEVISLIKSILPSSIHIDVKHRDDPLHIKIDPVQLHQLLMNLCVNAKDAMNGKGLLSISIDCVTLDKAQCDSCHQNYNGHYVVIAVSDTGSGIPKEIIEKIFEPFFTTKPIGEGSGMGLSVVHGIVHKHDGHIHVRSTQGEGSTFKVFFPSTPEAPNY